MSGLLANPCCGCGNKETQCARRYNFTDYPYLQWDLVDDPGGATPVHLVWDHINYQLDIEGEGSATVRATANLKTISIAAEIQSLTSGSAGVTVRRVDSAESISLWWMGGTSYELRHGTTVLESIVGSGSGEIKLELATPREATTDVLVYTGGTLAHTESAVAFVMPDVLHLGMIVDGEATFEWVELSPCPIHDCKPYVVGCPPSDQVEIAPLMPQYWRLNVPAFEDGNEICDRTQDHTKFCYQGLYSGGHLLLSGDNVVHVNTSDDPGDWKDAVTPEGCIWYKVEESRGIDPYPYPFSEPLTPPNGKYGTSAGAICTLIPNVPGEPLEWHYERVAGWQVRTEWRNTATFPDPPVYEHRFVLTCVISYTHEPNGGVNLTEWVDYNSAWFSTTSVENHDQDITLTRDGDGHTSRCLYVPFPETLTIKPVGSTAIDYDTFKPIVGCGESCEPPMTPVTGVEYFTWITFEDENGELWEYPTCLGIAYNETTGSWEWSGSSTQGHVHSTCGVLPDDILGFQVKIHCVEPAEGASKQWVMDITTPGGTARLLQVDDVVHGYIFEGAADNMCSGETWNVAASPLTRVDQESAPGFGTCYLSPCGAMWARADVTIYCSDGLRKASLYLARSGKGGGGSIPGVNPNDIYNDDFYRGKWPFDNSLDAWLWATSGSSYSFKITRADGSYVIGSGSMILSCDPLTLDDTLFPWAWSGQPEDPLGACPDEPGGFGFSEVQIEWHL